MDNLWEYDVVELFLAGPGHRYLEIELGVAGHFLVLAFDEVRHRSDEFRSLEPNCSYGEANGVRWVEIRIPVSMLPTSLRALNAFMIAGGQFLAYAPVPGVKPDFHQPDAFPPCRQE